MIIAEIGTSHGGDIQKAFSLIEGAKTAGADTVKFQWVYADEILHPKTGFVDLPTGKIPLYERFKQLEVPPDFFSKCKEKCESLGLDFLCSPFGLRSFRELCELKPKAIKIASPELNHFPLLEAVAEYRESFKRGASSPSRASGTEAPKLILSSGVSKIEDIEAALEIVGKENVTLLHCVTSYPAKETEYNLRVLETLKNRFGVEVGVSDHSLDPVLVPSLSIACGGTAIEKHITLSKKTDGLDDPVALEVEQFSMMTHCVRQCEAMKRQYDFEGSPLDWKEKIIEQMSETYGSETVEKTLGDGIKRLALGEESNYGRTNRSIHIMRDMKKGEIIKESDVAVLRTEKILTVGCHPKHLKTVIGKKLNCDVSDGDGLLLTMLE